MKPDRGGLSTGVQITVMNRSDTLSYRTLGALDAFGPTIELLNSPDLMLPNGY